MNTSTGVRPLLQGYWARSDGGPRECPTWHDDHKTADFRAEWYAGYDECADFKARERAEGRRQLTLEAIEKYHQRVKEKRDA